MTRPMLMCWLIVGLGALAAPHPAAAQHGPLPSGVLVAQDEPVQISSQQWREVLLRLERAEQELNAVRAAQGNLGVPLGGEGRLPAPWAATPPSSPHVQQEKPAPTAEVSPTSAKSDAPEFP